MPLKPLERTPKFISPLGEKINEIVKAYNGTSITAKAPLKTEVAKKQSEEKSINVSLSVDIKDLLKRLQAEANKGAGMGVNGVTSRSGSTTYSSLYSPFDPIVTGTTFSIVPGTINNLIPSNYLTGVTIPSTGTKYICLSCATSSGAITSAELVADASAPAVISATASYPPTAFKLLLAIVINKVPTKVWGDGNIQALPLEVLRVNKTTPVAGEMVYTPYYTWGISLV